MRGLFITFEGGEGAGKTTQIKKLSAYLKERGLNFVETREPGGTSIGESIREILLDNNNEKLSGISEALLYAAARAQHINELIQPCLLNNIIVICDRFVDSSIVYQGLARNLGADEIERINLFATGGLSPDITFYLDIPPKAGLQRKMASQKLDRLENETIDFHNTVRDGYNRLAKLYPDRIKKIDALQNANDVWEEIRSIINTKLL